MTQTNLIDRNFDRMQWHEAIPGKSIHPNEVHVWRVSLAMTAIRFENLFRKVSAHEVARAARFRFERDRRRFIAARGMLRELLGCYMGEQPHKLQFDYTPYGKPILASDSNYQNLSFNLSHSDDFALYAITRARSIGVDIERIRNDMAVDQIAQRFFSPVEISTLERIRKDSQPKVFFQYWARKEAFLKAIGEGISFPMEKFDVSLQGESSSPVTFLDDKIKSTEWYGLDLPPTPGYAAAIAVAGNNWDLSCCQWVELTL